MERVGVHLVAADRCLVSCIDDPLSPVFTVWTPAGWLADAVTSVEVVAVMSGVPVSIMVVLAVVTLRPFVRKPRWSPGQDWSYPAVLWTAHPQALRRDPGRGRATGETRGGARGEW